MTLNEMRARALLQAGEQEDAAEAAGIPLDQYLQEALMELTGGFVPRNVRIDVAGGWHDLTSVAGFVTVDRVLDAQGGEVRYSVRSGRILLPDGSYTLQYFGTSQAFHAPNDIPEIDEEYHGALADYATWRVLLTGDRARQARGETYYARYQLKAVQFRARQDARRGMRRLRGKWR